MAGPFSSDVVLVSAWFNEALSSHLLLETAHTNYLHFDACMHGAKSIAAIKGPPNLQASAQASVLEAGLLHAYNSY